MFRWLIDISIQWNLMWSMAWLFASISVTPGPWSRGSLSALYPAGGVGVHLSAIPCPWSGILSISVTPCPWSGGSSISVIPRMEWGFIYLCYAQNGTGVRLSVSYPEWNGGSTICVIPGMEWGLYASIIPGTEWGIDILHFGKIFIRVMKHTSQRVLPQIL